MNSMNNNGSKIIVKIKPIAEKYRAKNLHFKIVYNMNILKEIFIPKSNNI